MEQVRLSLDWKPNTNHSGIFVAKHNGWYEEEGLDLQILGHDPSERPDYVVGTGQVEFGISSAEMLTTGKALGRRAVSIAAIMQHASTAFVTLKSSGITAARDLAGKRYAAYGARFEKPTIEAVLRYTQAPTLEYQVVEPGVFSVFETLLKGEADFMLAFMGWEGLLYQHQGHELNVFYFIDNGIPDYYTPIILGSEDLMARNPEVVQRFLRATSRGYNFAMVDPDSAARILIEAAAKMDADFLEYDFVSKSQRWMASCLQADAPYWGYQSLRGWTEYPKLMFDNGVLVDEEGSLIPEPPDYQAYFTNKFLPNS